MSHANPRDLVFIVGMHRSGTSALARVMSLCGAALPKALLAANRGNPTGYWEPRRAMELNDGFLRSRASSWSDPGLAYRRAPRDHAGFARYAALIRDFLMLIHEVFADGFEPDGPVVFKEPRITALLPFWLTAAADAGFSPKVIHIFRSPADVASSLAARDGMTLDRACALWLKYNLLGEHDSRRVPRAFVSYEALIDDWRSVIARLTTEIAVDLEVRGAATDAVEAFLSPSLQHHRAGAIARNLVSGSQRKALRLAHSGLRRAAGGAVDIATFDSLLVEYSARWASEPERDERLSSSQTPISA